ncbi:Hypothetical predicted protein, partial [Paramuricea clavata]
MTSCPAIVVMKKAEDTIVTEDKTLQKKPSSLPSASTGSGEETEKSETTNK